MKWFSEGQPCSGDDCNPPRLSESFSSDNVIGTTGSELLRRLRVSFLFDCRSAERE